MAELKKLIDLAGLQAFKAKLMESAGNESKVTLESADGTGNTLKVYTLKQNGAEVGKINIPKDLVVTSGSVVAGTWNGETFTESTSGTGKAVKLIIANQAAPVYINVLDLCDVYTNGNGLSLANNQFSVKKDSTSEEFLSVGANGVKISGVNTAITTAISGLANGQVAANTNAIADINNETTGILAQTKSILGSKFQAAAGSTVQFYVEEAKSAADKANDDIAAMDFSSASTGSEYVKVGVTQVNGKVTGVAVTSEVATTGEVEALFN